MLGGTQVRHIIELKAAGSMRERVGSAEVLTRSELCSHDR